MTPLTLHALPAPRVGAPRSGRHDAGELYVDDDGLVYYCKSEGAPGTWIELPLRTAVVSAPPLVGLWTGRGARSSGAT